MCVLHAKAVRKDSVLDFVRYNITLRLKRQGKVRAQFRLSHSQIRVSAINAGVNHLWCVLSVLRSVQLRAAQLFPRGDVDGLLLICGV